MEVIWIWLSAFGNCVARRIGSGTQTVNPSMSSGVTTWPGLRTRCVGWVRQRAWLIVRWRLMVLV